MSITNDLKQFNYVFDLKISSKEDLKNRINHIKEELSELEAAIAEDNKEEIIDALVDITYLTVGTSELLGYDFDKHWSEVHSANMRRERTQDDNGKFGVRKPEGWVGPDHKRHL